MNIYGTLGPACCNKETLEQMIKNGMTGVRINLSHGIITSFVPWISELREAEKACGFTVDVLIDIEGPEVRIGDLESPIELTQDSKIILGKDIALPKNITRQLREGMTCFLDDGKIELYIERDLECLVVKGGVLKPRKSFAVKGCTLTAEIITERDETNLIAAKSLGIKGILQPFVRSGNDIDILRSKLADIGFADAEIYAKIEDAQGLNNAEEIAAKADYIVFARGDLGNNMDMWRLPLMQKNIAAICRKSGKRFIVATQLLSSMENSPVPTRAELNDIYNSALDGAAGLMLTGETAVGKYPAQAIKYLTLTAESAIRA